MLRTMIIVALLGLLTPAAQAGPTMLNWRPAQPVGAGVQSQDPPSAVACNGATYLGWRRPDGQVLLATWIPAAQRWSPPRSTGARTAVPPVLACDNYALTVVWRDLSTPPRVQLRSTKNGGTTWSPPELVSGPQGEVLLGAAGGSGNPGAAPFYVVWRNPGTDTRLHYATRVPGGVWQPVRGIPGVATDHAPEVDLLSAGVTVTYRATDGQIRQVTSLPGSTLWTSPAPTGPVRLTSATPAAAFATVSAVGTLDPVLVWKDSASTRMFYSARTGGGWSNSLAFPAGAGTSHAPTAAAVSLGGPAPRLGVVAVWKDPATTVLRHSIAY